MSVILKSQLAAKFTNLPYKMSKELTFQNETFSKVTFGNVRFLESS